MNKNDTVDAPTQQPVAWMTEDGRVSTDKTKQCMPNASAVNFSIPLYLRAEQNKEPAAWLCEDLVMNGEKSIIDDKEHAETRSKYRYKGEPTWKVTPLYTAPPAQQPARDDVLEEAADLVWNWAGLDDIEQKRKCVAAIRALQSHPHQPPVQGVTDERETIMLGWDSWVRYYREGGTGSWPRDCFEILLDWYDEQLEKARTLSAAPAEPQKDAK